MLSLSPRLTIWLNVSADWLPVYFQATKDAGPIAAGVDIFGISYSVSPFCLIAGAVIQKTQRYRQPMWFGWALMVIGTSLLSTLAADTSRAKSFGYQIMAGSGIGIIYVAAYFPVLAPIPVTKSAPALAFYTFLRNFALVSSITQSTTFTSSGELMLTPIVFDLFLIP